MPYYSVSNLPKREQKPKVCCGTRWKKTFQLDIDKSTGRKDLVPCGEENLYAKIQEHLQETKIYNILYRYTNGDESALNRLPGVYADVREMPTDLITAIRTVEKAEQDFQAMPLELRTMFGQDPNQFIAECISGQALEKLSKFKEQAQAIAAADAAKLAKEEKAE